MRIAGVARMGYFPIRPGAVEALLRHVRAEAGASILDPCCGEGAALGQLAAGLGIAPEQTFGVELDDGRAGTARAALPGALIVGPASFLACGVSPAQSLSLAYVNPPFDSTEAGAGVARQEEQFIREAGRLLKPGGVMAAIMPERVWWIEPNVRKHFDSRYERTQVFRFPEEHRPYGEVAVLGVRRRVAIPPEQAEGGGWFVRAGYGVYGRREPLPTLGEPETVYRVPAAPGPERIVKNEPTVEELAALLNATTLNWLAEPPAPRPPDAPPLALGEGHIALNLVAGRLNGLVCPPGQPPHVVRGTDRKERFLKEREETEDGGTKETFSEQLIPVVRAVWPDGLIRTMA